MGSVSPIKMWTVLAVLLAMANGQVVTANRAINDQVDVFFGTENGGNVFPGPARPYGMIKMGVDVLDSKGASAYSGYSPDGKINGISMMHESGTGGAPEYGVVAQLPLVGDVDLSSEQTIERSSPDSGSVGHYLVNATNGVTAEFAAADRAGIYKYSFPSGCTPSVLVNGSHHLSAPTRPWWNQYFVNGSLSTSSDGKYTGSTTIKGGWGEQSPWVIYYCGDFDTAPGTITGFSGSQTLNLSTVSSSTENGSFGFLFTFPEGTTSVNSRVGISFISTDQACQNIKNDFSGYNIEDTVAETVKIWNQQVFGKVDIETDNSTLFEYVYTALYGAHLLPSNRTGENPYWSSSEPYYDDFFTIWDTFRCLNPLFNILSPSRGAEIVRSLIDTWRNAGYTPDGRSANQNGRTQGGSNSDIVMADAYAKNIQDGINWKDGFSAMKKNAEVTPEYVYDPKAPDASNKEGRGALPDWLKYGYVTRAYTRSVTRTMEYAYDDFALSVVAKGLGYTSDAAKYLKRSANWKNIWNPEATNSSVSYKGFVQPKNADGSFNGTDYDPLSCGNCYWADDEYEGKPVEYVWAVPHDIASLVDLMGGNETFSQRLDDMFGLHGQGFADIGNEPSFLTPYLYNYVNAQHKSVELIRYLVNTKYSPGASGLPGNSDAGAMQAWLLFGLFGFYPVAGTTTYLLSSPFVPKTTFNLENGNKVEIVANNLSETNFYVQSVQINGEDWNKNWFSHEDVFEHGGTITFELGSQPIVWETGDVPPSPGHTDS
ncbi:putative secreted glycosidase [Meyerozyma sp. JA9]|nr:putative secreted glycosidase [Meyerozyma sp. JA9]